MTRKNQRPHTYRTKKRTLARARRLRGDMTEAEKKLWHHLRGAQLGGHSFRKQVPIDGYIVDFCCLLPKLIVEVDGGQHAEISAAEAKRARWLEGEGYRVLRFWNNEVLENVEGVLLKIAEALGAALDR